MAPELLAALIRLVGHCSELPDGVTPIPEDGKNPWSVARNVIRKAMGLASFEDEDS